MINVLITCMYVLVREKKKILNRHDNTSFQLL